MKFFSVRDSRFNREIPLSGPFGSLSQFRVHEIAYGVLLSSFLCLLAYLLALAHDDADRQAHSDVSTVNALLTARLIEDVFGRTELGLVEIATQLRSVRPSASDAGPQFPAALLESIKPRSGIEGFSVLTSTGEVLYSRQGGSVSWEDEVEFRKRISDRLGLVSGKGRLS